MYLSIQQLKVTLTRLHIEI